MKKLSLVLLLALTASIGSGATRRAATGFELPGAIGVLRSANMNSTADQAIDIKPDRYIIRRISVVAPTRNMTLAVGGLYTEAGKSGTTIVASTQVYTTLTGNTKYLDLTLAAGVTGDILTDQTIYFSLTTAQGTAATADIYVFGDPLP